MARRQHLLLQGQRVARQAEHLADSLAKGDRVMVTGRLRQRSWDTPEGDKGSVTEIEADEVGASLKWATAKVQRASQRGNGKRSSGRERQAERGGDFNDASPFCQAAPSAPSAPLGRCTLAVASVRSKATSSLPFVLPRTCSGERRGQRLGVSVHDRDGLEASCWKWHADGTKHQAPLAREGGP